MAGGARAPDTEMGNALDTPEPPGVRSGGLGRRLLPKALIRKRHYWPAIRRCTKGQRSIERYGS